MRALTLLIIITLLSGCVANIRTTVSTFKAEESLPASGTVMIKPLELKEVEYDELEFNYYRKQLALKLTQRGLTVVDSGDADLIAKLGYSVMQRERTDPHNKSRVRVSYGYPWGYGHSSVLSVNDLDSRRYEYKRSIKLKIARNKGEQKSAPLVSLTAESVGQCEHLSSVYDPMLTALFINLSQKNGSVISTRVKTSRSCSGQ